MHAAYELLLELELVVLRAAHGVGLVKDDHHRHLR